MTRWQGKYVDLGSKLKALVVSWCVLSLLGALTKNLNISVPLEEVFFSRLSQAEAAPSMSSTSMTGKDVAVVTGIGGAVGFVLGASTLPFYGSPTKHFQNAWMGLGAGLIAGLGYGVYLLTQDQDGDFSQNLQQRIEPSKDSILSSGSMTRTLPLLAEERRGFLHRSFTIPVLHMRF